MLTEGGRGSDQRICALYGELCGEPRPPQHPRFGPRRGCEIVLDHSARLRPYAMQPLPTSGYSAW